MIRVLPIALCFITLAAAQNNLLTPEEIHDGWISLYDGQTLFGWKQDGKAQWRSMPDGDLKASKGEYGWIRTTSPFADFILKLDYRTGIEGNSGIFLRSAAEGQPHVTGYELQIFNEHPKFPTGSLVNHLRAKAIAPAADQWHSVEVTAEGDHFTVKVDDQTVLDGHDSKSRSGYIGLQFNPNKPVEFHNIRLKPLGMKPLAGTVANNFLLQVEAKTEGPSGNIALRPGVNVHIGNAIRNGDRMMPADQGTGAIYDKQPARRVNAANGEFFALTVNASGNHYATWVNGYQVADWTDAETSGANPVELKLQASGIVFRGARVESLQ